jgi:hypothetical protein
MRFFALVQRVVFDMITLLCSLRANNHSLHIVNFFVNFVNKRPYKGA